MERDGKANHIGAMKAGESEAGLALTSSLLGIAVHVTVGQRYEQEFPEDHIRVAYRARLEGGVMLNVPEREETASAERTGLACLVIVSLSSLISVRRSFLGEDGPESADSFVTGSVMCLGCSLR